MYLNFIDKAKFQKVVILKTLLKWITWVHVS